LADKFRLLIVAQHLEGGGAERILSRLILNIYMEMDITLVTLYDRGRYLEQVKLLNGIEYKCIHAERGNTLNFVRRLRKIVSDNKPDKVLSFLYFQNILTYLALKGMNIPFILSERSNHRLYFTNSLKHRIWKLLLKNAYRRAQNIITVSGESKSAIISDFKPATDKVHVIYNGLSYSQLDKLKEEPVTEFEFRADENYIIAVGSLSKAKNYPLLISGYSILHSRHKNTELIVIGKGEMECAIREIVAQKGLDSVVHFMGYCTNPYKYLNKASCYVLSSSWEGFPNSLLEAMYINGHVISTDCPTGPAEIITHNFDGLLCEPDNPEELANAMGKMCFDEDFRKKVFENSRIKIATFDEEKMIREYRDIILKLS
jgi:GalNAc-alpha-(1->4)-GalNAc-alpha-(1->3)-diNAcBac-PP-undecaprenol alpha-1,4-N-acetyl-D-galactosaminyltransferase